MKYLLGFIGCGNMGGALVKAAAKSVDGSQIALCDYDENKARALAKAVGSDVLSACELVKNSRFIVLGVKPQNMQETVAQFADVLKARDDAIVITMAAGLSIAGLRKYIGADVPVIRIMPNTPALVGEGMIIYDCNGVSPSDEQAFLNSFAKAGELDKLNESLIDAASALSGCGPAFVYAFAIALTKGAEDIGVPKEKAEKYAAQTLRGAAKMLLEYGDAEGLKKAVCSPGGTTLAGLAAMDEDGFSSVVEKGVKAAYKRTLELKK